LCARAAAVGPVCVSVPAELHPAGNAVVQCACASFRPGPAPARVQCAGVRVGGALPEPALPALARPAPSLAQRSGPPLPCPALPCQHTCVQNPARIPLKPRPGKEGRSLRCTSDNPALLCPVLPRPAPSCPASSCPAPSCPALPCPWSRGETRAHLTISQVCAWHSDALPCPAPSCPVLPCPALLVAMPVLKRGGCRRCARARLRCGLCA